MEAYPPRLAEPVSRTSRRPALAGVVAGALALALPSAATAELPTAAQVAGRIGVGWNIGNTMEVPGGETGWGNPAVTQTLIDGVRAAGFNAVRIPCAWDSHANATTHVIDAAWLARVKQVVDYCLKNGMYVVLNIHWDGGWLENHPTYADQTAVNAKQRAYWTQIAEAFKGYDEHLLFAGMNEVNINWGAPSAENIAVQQSYLQTFVDAVRATGGNNASRTLAVQVYSTNIGYGLDHFTLPRDSATDRLLVEVHNYDPYDYTGNENGGCLYWGAPYPAQSACAWAQEGWFDSLFAKAKAKWVDRGIPVIIGEYGPMKRAGLTGQQLADHLASRHYYLKYFNTAAARNGLKTFLWDTGNAAALVDRNTGAVVDREGVDAILQGAGIDKPGVSYTLTTAVNGSGTVTRSPDAASYPGGTTVTLTATPAAGQDFGGWSGDLGGVTNPATVKVTGNMTVTASFVPAGFTLTVTRSGAGRGTVVSTPAGLSCGSTCSAPFSNGTSVTLTATPDGGSSFAGWGGACNGTGACVVSMTGARDVTATFDTSAGGSSGGSSSGSGSSSGGSSSGGSSSGGSSSGSGSSSGGGSSGGNSASGSSSGVPSPVVGMAVGGCATGGVGGALAILAPALLALRLRRRR